MIYLWFWVQSSSGVESPAHFIYPVVCLLSPFSTLPLSQVFNQLEKFFSPYMEPSRNIILPSKKLTYSNFISHQSKSTDLSDEEHVAFLYYWLSHYFFCTKSLQVTKGYFNLACLLHKGYLVCLSKLFLVSLYDSMGQVATALRSACWSISQFWCCDCNWYLGPWFLLFGCEDVIKKLQNMDAAWFWELMQDLI